MTAPDRGTVATTSVPRQLLRQQNDGSMDSSDMIQMLRRGLQADFVVAQRQAQPAVEWQLGNIHEHELSKV